MDFRNQIGVMGPLFVSIHHFISNLDDLGMVAAKGAHQRAS
jgi:hypothetical protein